MIPIRSIIVLQVHVGNSELKYTFQLSKHKLSRTRLTMGRWNICPKVVGEHSHIFEMKNVQ
jgi:hypothetical protein